MTTHQHEHYVSAVYPYTAQQAVADGLAVEPFPEITAEAGYRLVVLMTTAAYAEAVEWERDDILQDTPARYWDVLFAARLAAKRALSRPGAGFRFEVSRIPNRAANGSQSRAELPIATALYIRVEAFDWELTPCLVISVPGED